MSRHVHTQTDTRARARTHTHTLSHELLLVARTEQRPLHHQGRAAEESIRSCRCVSLCVCVCVCGHWVDLRLDALPGWMLLLAFSGEVSLGETSSEETEVLAGGSAPPWQGDLSLDTQMSEAAFGPAATGARRLALLSKAAHERASTRQPPGLRPTCRVEQPSSSRADMR